MTSDLVTELMYLAETKAAIKAAIKTAGTEVLDTDSFRSYATKIGQIDTFDKTYTAILQPSEDVKIFKSWLVDDVQPDQGTHKMLVVSSDIILGMNSGFTSSFDKVTGLKIIGGKYYTRAEIVALNNGNIYLPPLQYSRHGLTTGFNAYIIYFDDTITAIASFNSIANDVYICSQNVDIPASEFSDRATQYDMINCKVTLSSGYYSFNSSFPNLFAVSDYLSEGIPISFSNSPVRNIERLDMTKNPPYLDGGKFETFRYATLLSHIPTIVLPDGVTSLEDAFYSCYGLVKVEPFDTSKITNMYMTFDGCRSLQEVPACNYAGVTNFERTFNGCYSLKTTPLIDTYSATVMQSMFDGCMNLESVRFTGTNKMIRAYSMFNSCYKLKSVTGLDLTSMENAGGLSSAFSGCKSLETLEMTNITIPFDLSSCVALTKATVLGLISNLKTNTKSEVYKIIIPTALFLQLTEAELAPADAKNWAVYDGVLREMTVAGLTGEFKVGSTLTIGAVTPVDATFRCIWSRYDYEGSKVIAGATGSSYTLTQADVGHTISVTIAGTGTYIGNGTYASPDTVVTDPVDTIPPVVTMASQTASAFPDQQIVAKSDSAPGWLYLYSTSYTNITKYNLDTGAIKVAVTEANVDYPLVTTGLYAGTYKVYATDASCNVSLASANDITVTAGPSAVTITTFALAATDVQILITLAVGRFKPTGISAADFLYPDYRDNYNAIKNATYTRVSDTEVMISNLAGIVAESSVSLTIKASAQYAQVTTATAEPSDGTPTPIFTTLTELFGVDTYAKVLTDTSDDGTFTYKYPRGFKWKLSSVLYANVTVSGNSWLDPTGSSSERVKFNRRDSKVTTTKLMTGEYQGKLFSRITWCGAANYSSAQDQIWELYLLANGDAMIHGVQFSTTTGGQFTFEGVTYTCTSASPTICFYRQNAAGTSWTAAVENYDIAKNKNLV